MTGQALPLTLIGVALLLVLGMSQEVSAEEQCDRNWLVCKIRNATQWIEKQNEIARQLEGQNAAEEFCSSCAGAKLDQGPKAPDPAVAHLSSDIPLFTERAPVKVTMIGKFPVKQKHEGKIVYEWKGKSVTIPVIFEPRGAYRRQLCSSFPPFKIQFLKGQKRGRLFKNADTDLKFVTHCADPDVMRGIDNLGPTGKTAPQRILQEEISYRMLLSAGFPGLHTRLADVEYRDIEDSKEVARGTGFFIENIKDFGRRWGKHTTLPEKYHPQIAAKLAEVFVGNQDYSLNGHNVRHFRATAIKHYVPYDFDLTHLIVGDAFWGNAQLARETGRIIENLRRQSPETVEYFAKVMQERKDLLQKEVSESLLDENNREKFKSHIEKFIPTMQGQPSRKDP